MRSNFEVAAGMIEAECREKLVAVTTAEEALRITFEAAHNHWMFTDEQDQFKGAIGAALIRLKEGPEFQRLEKSLRALGKLSAMLNALQQGIPVNLEAILEEQEREKEDGIELIPLQKLWQEVRAHS